MLSSQEEDEWFDAETFDAEGDIIGKTKEYSIEEGYAGDNTTYISVKPNTKHQFIFHNSQDSEAAKQVDIAIKTDNNDNIRKMRVNESLFDAESFDAEMPKSVKMGFGFGAGLALFQVAVVGSAIALGMMFKE